MPLHESSLFVLLSTGSCFSHCVETDKCLVAVKTMFEPNDAVSLNFAECNGFGIVKFLCCTACSCECLGMIKNLWEDIRVGFMGGWQYYLDETFTIIWHAK